MRDILPPPPQKKLFLYVAFPQALYCLAAIIATGLIPALAMRPVMKSSTVAEAATSMTRTCDTTLLLLLASHFLGQGSKKICKMLSDLLPHWVNIGGRAINLKNLENIFLSSPA